MKDRQPPPDLAGLIYQIITTPGRELQTRAQVLVKLYLARHFSDAVSKHPECEKVLEELFAQCVKPLSGQIPPPTD